MFENTKDSNKKAHNGFTIIEVVLVLAVAGLIFLVVFAAVPRLQASRRDNQRKSDARTVASLIIEYESNTNSNPNYLSLDAAFRGGSTAPTGSFANYIDDNLRDPSGSFYDYDASSATPDAGEIYYYHSVRKCNPSGTGVSATTSTTDWVLIFGLERGQICIDNQ